MRKNALFVLRTPQDFLDLIKINSTRCAARGNINGQKRTRAPRAKRVGNTRHTQRTHYAVAFACGTVRLQFLFESAGFPLLLLLFLLLLFLVLLLLLLLLHLLLLL